MNIGGRTVANVIKNDRELLVKLTSAGLIIAAAQEKLSNYVKTHLSVVEEMKEDEDAMALFNLYYEENQDELKKCAAESVYTSNEAEKSLAQWREEEYGTEG